ncbi:hypothetical protein [Streptodolium elevatio]|uniref:Uncharacterized protein n=1 Tax=Streptodolium elevatio TaxID=3157996 RepID=A0ABV3DRA1_9ACTN
MQSIARPARGDVDLLELHGRAGTVRFESWQPLSVNISRHTVEELEGAAH